MVTALKLSPESEAIAPPGGWQKFVETKWERQPQYFAKPFPEPLADSNKVFSVLVKTSENARRGLETQPNQKGRVRFYIEHGHITSVVGGYLPTSDDESFAGYSARLLHELNGRDFTLIANNTQAADFDLWDRMRGFLSGLYALVGTPLRSEITIYTSKSRITAAGVHIDTYSNFLFQVVGHKRFRMWPSEVLRAKPHLIRNVDYEEILADAITAEVGPGDLLYIPSDYYHLAETDDDGLSVHMSFIINTESDGWYSLAERLACKAAKRRWNGGAPSPFLPPQPKPHAQLIGSPGTDKLLAAFNSFGQDIEEQMIAEFNRTISALGCELSPPARPQLAPLSDSDVVEGERDSIVSYEIFKQKLYLASNGQGFSCPAHPAIIDLLETLISRRNPCRVDALLDQLTGEIYVDDTPIERRREQLRSFLEALYKIRVIRLVNP